ncbi:MAG: hypothetical protein ABI416_04420 [Ginsengibacter sp.]
MTRIVIIHFSPVEYYPPLQNLVNVLSESRPAARVDVFTTSGINNMLANFKSRHPNIRIIRFGKSGKGIYKALRIYYYALFNLRCLLSLVINRPSKILYYETLSSFPAYFYKRFFNKKIEIYIHYHEYTAPAEYRNGMRLTKLFHKHEHWLYPHAKWVSHTNEFRMQMFIRDIAPVRINQPKILANYPPKAWLKESLANRSIPVKIVYIGSLSMDTMYTREFTKWVVAQNGKVTWDIYSFNITNEAKVFLETLNSEFIYLKDGINYNELPGILKLYDVGVLLYTGHILNYVFNAPNKLFEYLVCGLDVWYPEAMQGCKKYDSTEAWPKVLSLDFKDLDNYDLNKLMERTKTTPRFINFNCEDEFSDLIKTIVE